MTSRIPDAQCRAALLGLLIGDALGVPYEFKDADELPALITMKPPEDYPRSHASVPPGSWSDDGAMALCLAVSLTHQRELDLRDLTNRFLNWRREREGARGETTGMGR